MAGITDLPFRVICKEHSADALYSEMVSATGLCHNNKAKTLSFINSCKQDFPLFVQLFGSKPEDFAKATKLIDSLPRTNNSGKTRKPEAIDINFGCPVRKVIKQGAGCELMKDPPLARKIIQAVLANTNLPVSIKIRASVGKYDAMNLLNHIHDLDWKIVIVHGRTFKEGFTGPIDFKLIKKIKKSFPSKSVIANGGIFSPENAKKVLEKTGADGVAIARGALGNPWIFSQTKDLLKTGKYSVPTKDETKKVTLRHANLMKKFKGDKSITEFRKHLGWYFKSIPGAKKLRQKLFEINGYDELEEELKLI
ncbi:MAG: tRNA-dihydrouridine synthase [Patescibacteria group bacterium]|nr:tRNA-dihydrouridine synthase [Patescibacteria group bacterium]